MRLFLLSLSCLLLASCGGNFSKLNNTQAIETLRALPMATDERNVNGEFADVSFEELEGALEQYTGYESNNVRGLFGKRRARWGQLRNVFRVIQSQENPTAQTVADGLVEMNGGNAQRVAFDLGGILNIIKVLAPIISSFIPGLGPIFEAILQILPAILSLFGGGA